ncbi:DNA adenine methylase [Microcystis aeruginosa]|uniref:DNA adenine methylase n=1 Tax=Microcystis aeruginosa TaxID=1126 RepID=UPI00124C0C33|nr:DNA adenine methylase [Microcystis aeruginosa]
MIKAFITGYNLGFNLQPNCKKDQRFAQSYITKIVNQVTAVAKIIYNSDWTFAVADFRDTISLNQKNDLIYLDPPYSGRHHNFNYCPHPL